MRVDDLEYADDIGLPENEKCKAQKQLDAFFSVTKEVELMINVDETKVLSKTIEQKPEIKLDETVPEMVGDLEYLGT